MFQPNNTYGKGRPPGSKNKVHANVKEAFEKLFEANVDSLQEDLDKLEPRDRWKIILELSQFIQPKQKAQDIKFQHTEPINIPLIRFVKTSEN